MQMPVAVSPARVKAAPMAKTAILPPNAMRSPRRPQSAIQSPSYTEIPGSAISAAAAPDGSLWVLSTQPSGPDKYIWHYVSGMWTNISGLASQLAVAPNGTLYAINSGGGTYAYSAGSWTALGGGASAVTTAADGSVYVLSNSNPQGSDQAIWHNVGGTWTQVPGAGVSIEGSPDAVDYAVPGGTISGDGVYIVNSQGSIYYENTGGSFAELPANASALAPTAIGGVFALAYPANTSGNNIYYYNLNTPGWSAQPGAGVSISSNGGKLYVVGASGAIYSTPVTIASAPTPTITEYSIPQGEYVCCGGSDEITGGPDGGLWFTSYGGPPSGAQIDRITTGGLLTQYELPAGSLPTAITEGPDGNLWFVESNAYGPFEVEKITPTGTITAYATGGGDAEPDGVVAGPDGNLWFTENIGLIGKISTSGGVIQYGLPYAAHPTAIAAGPDGNLWFTDINFASGDNIGKITQTGQVVEYPIPGAGPGSRGAGTTGIAAGPDDNLWFTEDAGNVIGRITTNGTITEYPIPTSGAEPHGIAAGADGNLWFTESGSNAIGRITPQGAITEYPIPAGSTQPMSITSGPDGNLWFTAQYGNQIGKVTL